MDESQNERTSDVAADRRESAGETLWSGDAACKASATPISRANGESGQDNSPGILNEIVALGLALIAAVSVGLGWAVAQGNVGSASPDGENDSALGSNTPDFRPWSATAIPPPAERFSAVRPPSPITDLASWPHEALAILPDPNVLDPSFAPLRLEEVDAGIAAESSIGDGARIAIGGLDPLATRDLGRVLVTRTLATELVVANVGSADLVISRVYAGTRAIRASFDGEILDAAGYPPRPLVVPVGARMTMTLQLDGRRLIEHGTQAEHLQIFSNDQRHEIFDPADEFSHETRIRLVFDGRELDTLRRPVSPEELPLRDGEPRLWLPELALDGRGGDVVDVGESLPLGDITTRVEIRNIGSGTLVIEGFAGVGVSAVVEPDAVETGQSAIVEVTITPDENLDRGRWIRRQLTLRSNDPFAPLIELSFIGSWSIADGASDDGQDSGNSNGTGSP